MNIIESNLQFRSLSYGNNPDTIVLHHAEAETCTIYDIHQWHLENGWAGCGYHFLVRKDGSIYRGRPENAIGAHCPNENTHSIGICAEGDYTRDVMPQAQKQSIIELGQYIKSKYHITRVGGHKEFYSTDCPAQNYPLNDIKNSIMNGSSISSSNMTGGFVPNGSIRQLQSLINASVDGIAGKETLSKCPLLKVGSQSNVVKWLQYVLNSLDKENLAMDGIFGNGTKQAVQRYQAIKGLSVDGIVGQGTWSKILRLS